MDVLQLLSTGASCYYYYRHRRAVRRRKRVKRHSVARLHEVPALVQADKSNLLVQRALVAVQGRVVPCADTADRKLPAITCRSRQRLADDSGDKDSSRNPLMRGPVYTEADVQKFYIDDGTGVAVLDNPLSAATISLQDAGSYRHSIQLSGSNVTESVRVRILPWGACVTVVGEAVLTEGGKLVLRKPVDSTYPFIVSEQRIQQVTRSMVPPRLLRRARKAVLLASLLGVIQFARYTRRRNRRKVARALAAAAATRAAIAERLAESGDSGAAICRICFERARNRSFEPCHHFIACDDCARQVTVCPICRQRVTERKVVYAS